METLQDFVNEVAQIRAAMDELNVKGHENTAVVNYVYAKCNHIIQSLNQIANQQAAKAQEQGPDSTLDNVQEA